jgi:hypothetical protein
MGDHDALLFMVGYAIGLAAFGIGWLICLGIKKLWRIAVAKR